MSPALILCERIRTPPLDPEFLTSTRWATAEEKAKLGNAVLRFIAQGMPSEKFTASLYERLSSMFGFIAHCDRHGFAETWFADAATRRDFLDQIARYPCWGDPAFVWSDVEREIVQRIRDNLLVEAWTGRAREDQDAREKAELTRLMAKHGVTPASPVMAAPAVQLGLF